MGFYDNQKGVLEYEQAAKGHDGHALIQRLLQYLTPGCKLLELGMGLGKDLFLLRQHYTVVGSDQSEAFLSYFRQKHPEINVVQLDAESISIEESFHGIYSNKVLQHLTKEQLKNSLNRQAEILSPNGIALHSLWYGEHEEMHKDLLAVHYTEEIFKELTPKSLQIIESQRYTEIEKDDSIYFVLKKL